MELTEHGPLFRLDLTENAVEERQEGAAPRRARHHRPVEPVQHGLQTALRRARPRHRNCEVPQRRLCRRGRCGHKAAEVVVKLGDLSDLPSELVPGLGRRTVSRVY